MFRRGAVPLVHKSARRFSATSSHVHLGMKPTPGDPPRPQPPLSEDEKKLRIAHGWNAVAHTYTNSHHVHAAGSGHRRTFRLMEQLVVNIAAKRCEHREGGSGGKQCKQRATHGEPGRIATLCSEHAIGGMVNYKSSKGLPAPQLPVTDGTATDFVILDVASAGGEPALTLARALPAATVIGTDISPEMVALLRQNAERSSLKNVAAAVADGERLNAFGDGSVDAVTCAFGLMFMPSYEKALQEFHRVLKSDGFVAATVWAESVPRFTLLQQLQELVDPGARPLINPEALGGRGGAIVRNALEEVGFHDIQHSCYEVQAAGSDDEDAWEFLVMGTPFKATLDGIAARGRPNVYSDAKAAFLDIVKRSPLVERTDGGWWTVPGNMAYIFAGRKP